MSADYWIGFATPFALLTTVLIGASVVSWLRWWRIDPQTTFRGGWGYQHEFEMLHENGHWGGAMHTHWWPPDTPRWLVRQLEPIRVWICLRDPEHRATGAEEMA